MPSRQSTARVYRSFLNNHILPKWGDTEIQAVQPRPVELWLRERYGSGTGKAVWNLLLEAASGVSGQPDDTAAAVATWGLLYGYSTLEHSAAFGPSGPKGGLERGVEAFLSNFRSRARSVRKEHTARAADVRRRKKKP
jgi:hypothetical protein